ncbi:MAG: FtsX-like permease family protein [Spirochaetia bacterium]|jgi:lipoprotein-releasing system permease protein|nr:FtsX-like permease family protein [Spirochaetales bacterium]MDX9784430.1 FtsX-like permease family protein [Spirochaetia bacterium]
MTLESRLFAAARWGFSGKRRMSLRRAGLAAAGIAAGVAALIIVIGVMGGLQKGYIDSILEISSFHLRASSTGPVSDSTMEALRSLKGVSSALRFKETQVLAIGPSGATVSLALRAFEPGSEGYDPGLAAALGLGKGKRLPEVQGLSLGKEAAASLGADPGSEIRLFGMKQTDEEGVVPISLNLGVASFFTSGYYEFDSTMGFLSFEQAEAFDQLFDSSEWIVGIKLDRRFDVHRMESAVAAMLPEGGWTLVSWREYNRSFFGALRTEKTVMLLLVSLIFVVVGINIFHAMRRNIAGKMADIAVIKSFGASDADVRSIFLLDGLSIGISGALVGAALGLLAAYNINPIVEGLAAASRALASLAYKIGLSGPGGDYRLFSPAHYYIDRIPVSISAGELAFIAILAIASTGIAAFAAARRVSEASPSEVFRNE